MPPAAARPIAYPPRSPEKALESLFERVDVGLYLSDNLDRLIRANSAFCSMLGYSKSQILKTRLTRLVHSEDAFQYLNSRRILLGGKTGSVTFNARYIRKNGRMLWAANSSFLARPHDQGHPLFLSYVQDISRTELVDSEMRFRRLFETAQDGILILDGNTGKTTDVNPFVEQLLGYPRKYFLERYFWDLAAPEDIDKCKALFAQLKRTHYIRCDHVPLRHQSGAPVEVEVISNLYYLNRHPLVQCNVRDVTESKRASEALRESEERFRVTFDQASIGIAQIGLDGQLLRINQKYSALLGYSAEELMIRGLQAVTHPDDQAADSAFSRRVLAGEMTSYSMDKRYWRKDGILVWVSVANTLVFDAANQPAYFISIVQDTSAVQDITARKRLEEELLQARKMEAIGRLAGGVAHDFNNLLTVITGYCARILQRTRDEDSLRHEIGEISMAADRAAALTAKLLTFSRRQVLQRKTTNLNTVMVEVRELLRRLIGEDIELITAVEPGLGLVEADEGQIGQVIMNLAVNARDAMPKGGTLSIHLANVSLSEEYALRHLGVCSGRYVALRVRDTGCGMDAETQARMFEPFFTTKESGKGTGLGLSTVYGIVKDHGGHVRVESSVGTGTTVTVYLPRIEGPTVEREMARARTQAGGTERILVVEDDVQLRRLTAEVLRGAGYSILEAENGERALQLIVKETAPVHLLLTDIVMPGINGRVLAEKTLGSGKCGAVVYMSGYAGDAATHEASMPADAPLLVKPFTPERLLETVRAALDAAAVGVERNSGN